MSSISLQPNGKKDVVDVERSSEISEPLDHEEPEVSRLEPVIQPSPSLADGTEDEQDDDTGGTDLPLPYSLSKNG